MTRPVLVTLAGIAACAAVVSVAGAGPTAPPPALVGATQVGTRWTLRPLDPRTLAPVPGSWTRPVGKNPVVVRSPLGTGVIATWETADGGGAVVVDTRTGRVVGRYSEVVPPTVYWLGGELPLGGRDRPLLVGESTGVCWSTGCGTQYEEVGAGASEGREADTVDVLRRRLVLAAGTGSIATLEPPRTLSDGFTAREIELPLLPRSFPVRVVADVAGDRLYVISSGGVVARVDGASRRPVVSYHRVPLNGRPFAAVWAGQGRIAVWGADGLGTIDTRTWTASAVAPKALGVVPTRYGIASWAAGGLSVHRPDGTLRFRALGGEVVRGAEAAGRYLYVRARRSYAIDLVTGRVVGRVPAGVRIALPSFTPLP